MTRGRFRQTACGLVIACLVVLLQFPAVFVAGASDAGPGLLHVEWTKGGWFPLPRAERLTLTVSARISTPEGVYAMSPAPVSRFAYTAEESLKEAYAGHFLVGVAKDAIPRHLSDVVTRNFNAITNENSLKWRNVHPEPNTYRFGIPDAMFDYAEAHGMQVVGHCLVWHDHTPDWLVQDENGHLVGPEVLLARLEEHIKTVVGRYRGRARGWDVVNEALADNGAYRDSSWYRILGEEFIVKAFQFAHEADPDAELYYNDYNIENPAKLAGAIRIVRLLQERGIRIDAVGIQGHWGLDSPSTALVGSAIGQLSALGVKVNITELDVSLLSWGGTDNPYPQGIPPQIERRQATRYAELFRTFRKNSAVIDRITFWCITDGDSWLSRPGRRNYPLLFHADGSYKEAYWAVLDPEGYLASE